jgi:hypothetical protein
LLVLRDGNLEVQRSRKEKCNNLLGLQIPPGVVTQRERKGQRERKRGREIDRDRERKRHTD